MTRDFNLEEREWWAFLEEDLQELLLSAVRLVKEVEEWKMEFHDYSFVVFPAAKAYEGFLKKLFLEKGFIDRKDYYGKHFRVGKSLNPSLPKRLRDEDYVYDDVERECGGKEVGKKLWSTWKNCRNLLFHWFPDEKRAVGFEEAKRKVLEVIDSVDTAYDGCKIENRDGKKEN